MNEDPARVITIFKSLVSLNEWHVVRFDIQRILLMHGMTNYVGYLTISGEEKTLVIRSSGIFKWI